LKTITKYPIPILNKLYIQTVITRAHNVNHQVAEVKESTFGEKHGVIVPSKSGIPKVRNKSYLFKKC